MPKSTINVHMLWGRSIAPFCVLQTVGVPVCACASSPIPTWHTTHTKQTYLASAVMLQYTNLGKIRLRTQQEKKNTNIHSSTHKMHFMVFLYQPVLMHSYTQTRVWNHTPLCFSLSLLFHTPTHSQKMCKETLPHKQNTHRIFLWEMALKGKLGNSLSHSKRHPTHCSWWP